MVRRILVVAALLCAVVAGADAETRRALLVGVENYAAEVGPLENPHKDVDLLDSRLTALGFKTTVLKDTPDDPVTRSEILSAVREHAEAIADDPDAVSFFYYSGHGAANAEDGDNYLVPSGVTSTADASMWDLSVNLNTIQDRLLQIADKAAHFVVIDACRNELKLKPASRSLSKGFEVKLADLKSGVFLAFSTDLGATATDGDADAVAGPYAMVLADEIGKPGVRHSQVFDDVRLRMVRDFDQEPFMVNNIIEPVFLNPGDGEITVLPPIEDLDDADEPGMDTASDDTDADAPISIRKALVVSNTDYASPFNALPSAHETADEFAATLQAGSFSVTRLKNPSREALFEEMQNLYDGFDGSAVEKVAVIHYIGHARGGGSNGPNYLIPANTAVNNAFSLQFQGIELSKLLDASERPDDVDTFIFVEGCGDTPISGLSSTGCAPEPDRDHVSLTLTDLVLEEPEPSPSGPDRDQTEKAPPSYTAVLSDELIKGGSLSDAVKRANDSHVLSDIGSKVAVSGEIRREYELPTRSKETIEAIKEATPSRRESYTMTDTIKANPQLISGAVLIAARACYNAVQNKVAWDEKGASRRWSDSNIERLCKGAETSTAPASCFDSYMNRARRSSQWPAKWTIGVALCAGASSDNDSAARIACLSRAGAVTAETAKACASDRQKACFNAVQNKIAWDAAGRSKSWNANNINNLCRGAEFSTTPAACFDTYMKRARSTASWPTQWGVGLALCVGAKDNSTLSNRMNCFSSASAKDANTAKSCAARFK